MGSDPACYTGARLKRLAGPQQVSVELFDVLGRRIYRVLEGDIEANRPMSLEIDARSLPPGLYLLRASGEFFTVQSLLVVAR